MNDVRTTRLAASGSIVGTRARVKYLYIVCSGTAGSVVIRDGGSGGTVKATFDTPASATTVVTVDMPGDGLLCDTDVYATLTNVTAVTVAFG